MNSVESLIEQVKSFGATLIPLEGDRLKVRAPRPLPDDLKAALKRHKPEILALLRGRGQAIEAHPGLLELPMVKLTKPLPVWSALLGETIYLVPDEATALKLLAEGKPAYFPQEVAILLEIKARWPETWQEKVRKIHLAKKEFGGLVTELREREVPPGEDAGGAGGVEVIGHDER